MYLIGNRYTRIVRHSTLLLLHNLMFNSGIIFMKDNQQRINGDIYIP